MRAEIEISGLLASALTSLPEAVLLTEIRMDGQTIVFANESFQQLTGYRLAEIEGRDLMFLQGPETDKAALQRFLEASEDSNGGPLQVLLYNKAGVPFWDQVTARRLHCHGADYSIQVHADTTLQKEIQDQLVLSQKRETAGHLVSGIAHDFNNLLTAIMVYSGLMTPKVGPDAQRYLKEINASASRGAQLVAQLMDLGRQDKKEPEVINLAELLEEMQDLLKRILGENINLRIDAGENAGKVRLHPGRIQQVLLNLGINARDAMPHGGDLMISLSNLSLQQQDASRFPGASAGEYAMLMIGDTGSGMDAETRANLFKPFFTTKAKGKGTGLGLFTVQAIIHQCDGHIYVESEPGEGSAFTILLPSMAGPSGSPGKEVLQNSFQTRDGGPQNRSNI